jgi:hypothetical protein
MKPVNGGVCGKVGTVTTFHSTSSVTKTTISKSGDCPNFSGGIAP